jgi:hypothetical protein
VDNILNTAFGGAEKLVGEWLEKQDIELISVSPTCVVDDKSTVGKYTYIITVAYKAK